MIINGNEIPETTDEWIQERMADNYGLDENWTVIHAWDPQDLEATARAIKSAARTAENIIREAAANAEIGR